MQFIISLIPWRTQMMLAIGRDNREDLEACPDVEQEIPKLSHALRRAPKLPRRQ